MPSRAFGIWAGTRRQRLDEMLAAHRAVGGTGRGRRRATEQINHAYAVLLSAQFQGYCRDLHTECVELLVASVEPIVMRPIVRQDLLLHRKLDRENPNPGNLGADYNRLGLRLREEVEQIDARNRTRFAHLESLNRWRNAIAHQDFSAVAPNGEILRLERVRTWRRACEGLAEAFDAVMARHVGALTGAVPWR